MVRVRVPCSPAAEIAYAFWWNKPLNVLCPIYLHIRPEPAPDLDASNTSVAQPVIDPNENRPLLGGDPVGEKRKEGILGQASRTLEAACTVVHDVVHAGARWAKQDIDEYGWWCVLKWLIAEPVTAIGVPFDDLIADVEVHDEATHVKTFYGMDIPQQQMDLAGVLVSFIGMIFGAIHLLSWHSSFPTPIQLLLWRISSIALVIEPFIYAVSPIRGLVYRASKPGTWKRKLSGSQSLLSIWAFHVFVFGVAYVAARVGIIVLTFLTLRDLPLTAFQSVSWVSYIPHV